MKSGCSHLQVKISHFPLKQKTTRKLTATGEYTVWDERVPQKRKKTEKTEINDTSLTPGAEYTECLTSKKHTDILKQIRSAHVKE